MPELNDISLHQLIAQWEKDLEMHLKEYDRTQDSYFFGRAEEVESCIHELKQVLGLLP